MSTIMLVNEAVISRASSNLPFLNHHNISMEVNDAETMKVYAMMTSLLLRSFDECLL